ncbi:TRITHORAX-RELATED PROTEIN 6 isoform X2 [Wolffia australiana]
MAAATRKRTRAPSPNSHLPSSGDDASSRSEIYCEECGLGDSDEVLLLCDKCNRGFHTFCLRPILPSVPNGSWFCPSCSLPKIPRQFPLVQTKIVDFFRIQRPLLGSEAAWRKQQKRRRAGGLVVAKKKRKLLPFSPSEDPKRRLAQMASLATALTATGTQFSDFLTYSPGMVPRSANCPALEREGMQVISKEDAEALNMCKKMMETGNCAPLMVIFDPKEGFTVEADKFIKDLTIVAEYVGDVDYLKNREHDDGDSMMTLLCADDPANSLVICPNKRGNIARFISGINNYSPSGKKKQNLKCVRFNVDGESRVLLIAIRDILEGERLYYDYNGYEKEYPTEHFF